MKLFGIIEGRSSISDWTFSSGARFDRTRRGPVCLSVHELIRLSKRLQTICIDYRIYLSRLFSPLSLFRFPSIFVCRSFSVRSHLLTFLYRSSTEYSRITECVGIHLNEGRAAQQFATKNDDPNSNSVFAIKSILHELTYLLGEEGNVIVSGWFYVGG